MRRILNEKAIYVDIFYACYNRSCYCTIFWMKQTFKRDKGLKELLLFFVCDNCNLYDFERMVKDGYQLLS